MLIVDDFLATGTTGVALHRLVEQAVGGGGVVSTRKGCLLLGVARDGLRPLSGGLRASM